MIMSCSTITASVLLFTTLAILFQASHGQDTLQAEALDTNPVNMVNKDHLSTKVSIGAKYEVDDKSKQTWSKVTDVKTEENDDLDVDEDKRAAHIFRYGRAPVFRYGKRAPAVFRYGKKATVFRYGKRSEDSLTASDDNANLEHLTPSEYGPDYFPATEEHKRKIFRYGKRSA